MKNICVVTGMVLGTVLQEELNALELLRKEQGMHPLSYACHSSVIVQEVCSITNIKELKQYVMADDLSPQEANDYISGLLLKSTNQMN